MFEKSMVEISDITDLITDATETRLGDLIEAEKRLKNMGYVTKRVKKAIDSTGAEEGIIRIDDALRKKKIELGFNPDLPTADQTRYETMDEFRIRYTWELNNSMLTKPGDKSIIAQVEFERTTQKALDINENLYLQKRRLVKNN